MVHIFEASQICWHFTVGILYTPKGECGVNWTDLLLVSENIDIKAGKNQCGFLHGGFHFDFQGCIWGFDAPRNAKWNLGVWVHVKPNRLLWMEAEFQLGFLSPFVLRHPLLVIKNMLPGH